MKNAMIRPAVLLSGALLLGGCTVFGAAAAPEPEYTTVRTDEAFEVRQYGELVVVSTTMNGSSDDAFRRLFAYITGANEGARKIDMTAPVLASTESTESTEIAMTAPVLQSQTGDGANMLFVLTDEFTADTAPIPTDPAVVLGTIPARQVAVVTYSGSWQGDSAAAEDSLRAWMSENGLVADGSADVAGYNPPWTLPMFRRNEVQIPIAAN